MSDDIRWRLRNSTETRHAELDLRMSDLRLDRRQDYARFISVNAVTIPIERLLEDAGVEGDMPDWRRRARSQALIADLNDLGLPNDARLRDAPDLRAPAARLGLVYILEGSRLGAAVLRKAACASADPRVRAATRFLRHGEGQDHWRSFLSRLAESVWSAQDRDRACDSARWGFDQYLARTGAVA